MKNIIALAQKVRVAHIATIEASKAGVKPRVRAFHLWFADDTGFYFQTTDLKSVGRQVLANRNIEVEFFVPGPNSSQGFQMLRIEGAAEILHGRTWEEKAHTDRPWLLEIDAKLKAAGKVGSLVMFRLAHGEARVFDMSFNCREDQIPVVKF